MKQRNPDANCGNCPYFELAIGKEQQPNERLGQNGWCRREYSGYHYEGYHTTPSHYENGFCGWHPEFWLEPQFNEEPF